MNRRHASMIIALACLAGVAVAAQAKGAATGITANLPAAIVNLKKSEIYSVDDYKAAVARLDAVWSARVKMDSTLSEADREKAKMEIMVLAKPRLLDEQIGAMLFKQFCEREGVTASEAEIAGYIARIKAQLGATGKTDEAVEQLLIAGQQIILDLKTTARGQVLLKKYIQAKKADELKAIPMPSSEAILAAYDEMKPQLLMPETARISIVYMELGKKSAEERKKAQDAMRDLAAKVRDDSSYFDKLLLASYDSNTGYVARGSYVVANLKGAAAGHSAAFVDAVFKLRPGEISGLLENEEGLQIVRLNEVAPSKQLTLYDAIPGGNNVSVQDLIVEQLVQIAQESYATKLRSEILEKIRKEATITIMKDNLRGLLADTELDSFASRYAKKK